MHFRVLVQLAWGLSSHVRIPWEAASLNNPKKMSSPLKQKKKEKKSRNKAFLIRKSISHLRTVIKNWTVRVKLQAPLLHA